MDSQPLRILIFGTGEAARGECAHLARCANVSILGFVDNDPRRQGSLFQGFPVFAPEQILSMPFDRVVIASMHVHEIGAQLKALGIPAFRIHLSLAACSHLALSCARSGNPVEARRFADLAASAYGEPAARQIHAELAMQARQWGDAIRLFEQVGHETPAPDPQVLARLACALRKNGELDRAEDVARQGLDRWPNNPHLLMQAAEAAVAREDWSRAIDGFSRSIEADHGRTPNPYARLAHACAKALDFDRAALAIRQGIERHPNSPMLLKEQALASFATQDWETSLAQWRYLWKNGIEESLAYSRILTCCGFTGRHEEMSDLALDMARRRVPGFHPSPWHVLSREWDRLQEDEAATEAETQIEDHLHLHMPPPAEWWLSLYFRHYVRGRYRLAYRFKQMAARMAADSTLPYPMPFATAVGGLMETNRRAETEQRMREAIHAAPSPRRRAELQWDLAAILFRWNRTAEARAIWDHNEIRRNLPHYCNPSFEQLIRGKSVAVVGGGDIGLRQGNEIDAFDVVVRTNHLHPPSSADAIAMRGARTTVSYYAFAFIRHYADAIADAGTARDLQAAVIHNNAHVASRLNARCGDGFARCNASHASHVFMGFPLSAQRIVLDLLPFQPARIKVFNCDFYLGGRTHHKDYAVFSPLMPAKLAHHDLLRNWRLARTVFSLAGVESDPRLADILAMTEDDFIDALRDRWHPPA